MIRIITSPLIRFLGVLGADRGLRWPALPGADQAASNNDSDNTANSSNDSNHDSDNSNDIHTTSSNDNNTNA